MLTLQGVPDELAIRYEAYKTLAKDIYHSIDGKKEPTLIKAETDLLEYADNAPVCIIEGYFALIDENKTLRLYSDSDFVIPSKDLADCALRSEFAAEIVVFDRETFFEEIRTSQVKFEKWIELQNMENALNLSLLTLSLDEEIKLNFEVRQFNDGDIITKEGDEPNEVFEMISGQGTVLLGGQEIGRIGQGEIFGEIGFLTESARTATVVAEGNCFLRLVNKEDFIPLIESNPAFSTSIAKILSERIVQLNNKLLENSI